MSDSELEKREQEAGESADAPETDAGDKESEALDQIGDGFKPEGGKPSLRSRFNGSSRRKKAALAGAGVGGGGMLLMIVLILFLLLGLLKTLHISTLIRTTGFAASQYMMREAFTDSAYQTWIANNEGTVELPKSSLLDRLRGQNMRKVQENLQENGKFQYVGEEGSATGIKVRGEEINFDELASRINPEAKGWGDLTFREKMTGNKYMTDQIKVNIGEDLQLETRGFRNAFWDGFREATGIKMSTFRDIVRDKFGKGEVVPAEDNEKARLKNELEIVDGTDGDGVTSSDGNTEEAAKDIDAKVSEGADKGVRVKAKEAFNSYLEGKGSSLGEFQEGMSKASTVVLVTSLYCMAHDLSQVSDRLNKETEVRLARFGHEQQTTADQIRAGDVTTGDTDFANKEWNADDTTPDATASPLYQEAIGNTPENDAGLENAPRMNISLPFLDWFKPIDGAIKTAASGGTNKVPVVGGLISDVEDTIITKGCGVVTNPLIQFGTVIGEAVLGVISAGTTEAALQGFGKAVLVFAAFAGAGYGVGKLINWYIEQAASPGVTGNETGADRYTASAVSTDYLNSQAGRGTTYGRPLSSDEASGMKTVAMASLRNQYSQGSLYERYASIDNPFSLWGQTAAKLPNTPTGLATASLSFFRNSASTLAQPVRLLGSMLGSSKVHAAVQGDLSKRNAYFGVDQWGWTTSEMETFRQTDLFQNAAEVEADIGSNPSYYEKLADCYAPDRLMFSSTESGGALHDDGDCSQAALSKPEVLKWRIYKLSMFSAAQISSEGLNVEQ